MKNILFLTALLIAFVACGDDKDALKNSVLKMNEKCPVQQKHWTIDSLGISNNGEIVYFCNTDQDADYFEVLKAKKDSIKNVLIDNLNNDKVENSMKLVKLCKQYNAGIVYKYYSNNTNDKVVIKIPVEKLLVNPAIE
jgi:hypothetical protein